MTTLWLRADHCAVSSSLYEPQVFSPQSTSAWWDPAVVSLMEFHSVHFSLVTMRQNGKMEHYGDKSSERGPSPRNCVEDFWKLRIKDSNTMSNIS